MNNFWEKLLQYSKYFLLFIGVVGLIVLIVSFFVKASRGLLIAGVVLVSIALALLLLYFLYWLYKMISGTDPLKIATENRNAKTAKHLEEEFTKIADASKPQKNEIYCQTLDFLKKKKMTQAYDELSNLYPNETDLLKKLSSRLSMM